MIVVLVQFFQRNRPDLLGLGDFGVALDQFGGIWEHGGSCGNLGVARSDGTAVESPKSFLF